ncbi:formyl transferase, partial [Blyttiomyces helicus]
PPLLNTTPAKPFDVAVVVSFRYFLPGPLIRSFPAGAFNIHPSLLPKYRGAAPIQHTILGGDEVAGVSIIDLDDTTFDAGRILRQIEVPISPKIYYDELHDRLAEIGASEMFETLRKLEYHKANDSYDRGANSRSQDKTNVTYAPKIDKGMSAIDLVQMGPADVFRLHRAIGSKQPIYTTFKTKRIQLLAVHDPDTTLPPPIPAPSSATETTHPPGTLFYDPEQKQLWVRCGGEGWLAVSEMRVEGKTAVRAGDFANGYQFSKGGVVVGERFGG